MRFVYTHFGLKTLTNRTETLRLASRTIVRHCFKLTDKFTRTVKCKHKTKVEIQGVLSEYFCSCSWIANLVQHDTCKNALKTSTPFPVHEHDWPRVSCYVTSSQTMTRFFFGTSFPHFILVDLKPSKRETESASLMCVVTPFHGPCATMALQSQENGNGGKILPRFEGYLRTYSDANIACYGKWRTWPLRQAPVSPRDVIIMA